MSSILPHRAQECAPTPEELASNLRAGIVLLLEDLLPGLCEDNFAFHLEDRNLTFPNNHKGHRAAALEAVPLEGPPRSAAVSLPPGWLAASIVPARVTADTLAWEQRRQRRLFAQQVGRYLTEGLSIPGPACFELGEEVFLLLRFRGPAAELVECGFPLDRAIVSLVRRKFRAELAGDQRKFRLRTREWRRPRASFPLYLPGFGTPLRIDLELEGAGPWSVDRLHQLVRRGRKETPLWFTEEAEKLLEKVCERERVLSWYEERLQLKKEAQRGLQDAIVAWAKLAAEEAEEAAKVAADAEAKADEAAKAEAEAAGEETKAEAKEKAEKAAEEAAGARFVADLRAKVAGEAILKAGQEAAWPEVMEAYKAGVAEDRFKKDAKDDNPNRVSQSVSRNAIQRQGRVDPPATRRAMASVGRRQL
jgi:hypothetical protein